MKKSGMIVVVDSTDDQPMSFAELCVLLQTSPHLLQEFISYEIIHPQGRSEAEWQFGVSEIVRVKKALRLHHELEINLAGVAVVLDLLDELDELREKLGSMERHYK